jgi:hypothetical protein
MAGMGGSAGSGGATAGGAGAGGAMAGGGGAGGTGGAGTSGGAGKGGSGGAGAGGAGAGGAAAGMGGSSAGKGGSGGAQAGAGSGGMSGTAGAGGAGAGSGGAGAGGKGGAGAGGKGGAGAGGGGVLMELAGDRPATADSEETSQGNLAADGNDGMADTRWCAANGGPHYWQVDLGAVHPLQRIEIDFEYPPQADGASYGYVVTVSDDGTTFNPGIDRSTNTQTSATQTAMFPANTSGRHVRVLVTPPDTTPSATWASLWEVRVFGY